MSLEEKIKNAKEVDFFDEIPKEEQKEIIYNAKMRAELESIKAEIDNCLIHNPDYDECNVNIGLGISYEIIKKHISELKGDRQ